MSLVNVNCINCKAEFKVTKEAANSRATGFVHQAAVCGKLNIDILVCWCAKPEIGELCPRCACAAMRVLLNNTEKDLPDLMNGKHLLKGVM